LVNEKRKGRIERLGDSWRIVPAAFPPDLLAAVAALDEAGGWSGYGSAGS
jgi:hypothetical protein